MFVNDLQKARRFYELVPGLQMKREWEGTAIEKKKRKKTLIPTLTDRAVLFFLEGLSPSQSERTADPT